MIASPESIQLCLMSWESKSLISPTGACEYAKRFRLNRCSVDVSPLSIKRQVTTLSPLGWVPAPEVIGAVIQRLREHFRVRDPVEPPLDAFAYPGHRDFLEWSLYQGWMRSYLSYLKWYVQIAMDPCVSLQDFIDPPIFIRTWHASKVDLSTFRFGVMFRIIDWVSEETRKGHKVIGR